jgi:cytidylate kinase
MCPQKRIVVALYGRSCSGKSTIARELSQLLNCPIHSAGELVRKRSKELGIPSTKLPLVEHRLIDNGTRTKAKSADASSIVDGSFLDALFYDMEGVYRIELICSDEERRRRFNQKSGCDGLAQRDKDDDELRLALHGARSSSAEATFNTTSKTPGEVAQEITRWLETKTATKVPG